jgi:hypothetical protein
VCAPLEIGGDQAVFVLILSIELQIGFAHLIGLGQLSLQDQKLNLLFGINLLTQGSLILIQQRFGFVGSGKIEIDLHELQDGIQIVRILLQNLQKHRLSLAVIAPDEVLIRFLHQNLAFVVLRQQGHE